MEPTVRAAAIGLVSAMTDLKIDINPQLVAAMKVCVDHARALLESARIVQAAKHSNVAYHLAALCLEELGRRALLGVQAVSEKGAMPPAWPKKHEQDHIKKLFWAIFGSGFLGAPLTDDRFREMTHLAEQIHAQRLLGLYVGVSDEDLTIPAEQIDAPMAEQLISFAQATLNLVSNETFQDEVPQEAIDLQAWLLSCFEDPERRKQILSRGSLDKLAELRNVGEWIRWLKGLFEKAEADGRLAAQKELERSRNLPTAKIRDKWRLRIRIMCASHSIRPSVLSGWNKKSAWIKLSAVSGRKNELFIDFIFGDNVPVQALWFWGWGVARQFVVALNMGTMGFWWWRMPEHVSRYYESIRDLESGHELKLERSPSLRIDWGENRTLTLEDLGRVAMVFASLPPRDPNGEQTGLDFYVGGITFLSLNDVHWQCAVQSFGNFFESLRAMMAQQTDWIKGTPFEPAFLKFLDVLFPSMDERARYAELVRAFDEKKLDGVVITLKEVSFLKLFCDAYFLKTHQPKALKELEANR